MKTEKEKRPVKCYICGKQMYYFGEKEYEPEYEIYSTDKHKGYVHQRCIKELKREKKAKEEFNKKVEEETLRLEANLFNSLKSKDWEIINKYFGIFREEIDKIFNSEKEEEK